MKFLYIFIILLSTTVFAQKEVFSVNQSTFTKHSANKESYFVTNSENGNLTLLIGENSELHAYHFDEELNNIDHIQLEHLDRKYKDFIGYQIKESKHKLLFSDERRKLLGIIEYDFTTKKTKTFELDFKLKGEYFIESFTVQNKFYMLSIETDSDKINVRALSEDNSLMNHIVPFNEKVNIYDLLVGRNDPKNIGKRKGTYILPISNNTVYKVDKYNVNEIENTIRQNKVYSDKNHIVLTFDDIEEATLIYKLNLTEFSIQEIIIEKPLIASKAFKKSNSFYCDDFLFQLLLDKEKLKLIVNRVSTGELLKTFDVNSEGKINFKNSSFYNQDFKFLSDKKKKDEIESTKKFLRKMKQGEIGLVAHFIDGKYYLEIGSFYPSNSGFTSINGNLLLSGNGSSLIYFNSIFDTEMNHVDEVFEENINLKVRSIKDNLRDLSAEKTINFLEKTYLSYFDLATLDFKLIEVE